MDFKFNWDSSIEIGIPNIDAQHKELFRIGRSIEQLIITNYAGTDDEQLLDIICEVRNYITYHFYEEEMFMKNINYANFVSHKNYHDLFKIKINSIDCTNLKNSLEYLKELLTTWFFEHILIEDHNLKP